MHLTPLKQTNKNRFKCVIERGSDVSFQWFSYEISESEKRTGACYGLSS